MSGLSCIGFFLKNSKLNLSAFKNANKVYLNSQPATLCSDTKVFQLLDHLQRQPSPVRELKTQVRIGE